MLKLLFSTIIVLSLFGQSSGPKVQTKKGGTVKAPYDPDKLGPGEVACGRVGSKNSAPCKCMEHRSKELARQREKCYSILNEKEQKECFRKTDDACAVHVVDADEERNSIEYSGDFETGKPKMPKQCSRSCTKAKCECCHS